MEQQENTFAMSQCMLTKQYGKVQSGHPVFSGGPAGNRGKSSVADYGSLCGTPMRISELMLHWFDRKTGQSFSVLVIGFSLYI